MAPRKTRTTRATAVKYTKRKRTTNGQILTGESSNGTPQGEITLSQPLKKKGRGPGRVVDSTQNIEDRPVIWPVGQHEFSSEEDPRQIVASITRLALNYMPSPLRSFHSFDLETKNTIEKAFLERFTYREGEDPHRCREVLEAIACKRYSEEMNTARDKCNKEFGQDIEKWKGMVPHWCLNPTNWHGLCDIFATDEWQGLSKQNHSNRTSSGLTVSHYGGSASVHQHKKKLKKLLNGTEPTKGELYLHIHCKLPNGKSPVVAQYEASIEGASQPTDDGDGNGLVNPSTEGTTIQPLPIDINSLQFTNARAQKVYEDVTEKLADEANADKDETTLFINAVGGQHRGRVRGFGCVLDNNLPPSTMRSKPPCTVSSISGLTTLGEKTFTESQMSAMLEERDRRHEEEREERKRDKANNYLLFSQLFSLVASQKNNLPAQALSSDEPPYGVVMGNMPNLQDLAAAITDVNQGGTYQSLLSLAQTGQEAASAEAAMNQWFGQGN